MIGEKDEEMSVQKNINRELAKKLKELTDYVWISNTLIYNGFIYLYF